MELVLLLAAPLALALVTRTIAARAKRKPPPAEAPDPYVPPTFDVIALGTSGCGKTVFLASMFHALNFQVPYRSYYLETDVAGRLKLSDVYRDVVDTEAPWPRGTRIAETQKFVFDCVGVEASNKRHTVLRMSYLDYAGELLEEGQHSRSAALADLVERMESAHALLAMIDGHRVLQLLKGEHGGHEYVQHSLRPMTGLLQGASCPIHLVLTKWDVLRELGASEGMDDRALLDRVIQALLAYEHIRSLAYFRSANQVVRLIPVSSVGSEFAELDAAGNMVKRPDGELRPTNVDVPLCAVLPDMFKQVEGSLDESMRRRVNADILKMLREDAGLLATRVLALPGGAALRTVLQGVLGRDAGDATATLFLEWIAGRSRDGGRLAAMRLGLEERLTKLALVRAKVMDDFARTVLRLDEALPNSELSRRW
jgi:hypothetical protein